MNKLLFFIFLSTLLITSCKNTTDKNEQEVEVITMSQKGQNNEPTFTEYLEKNTLVKLTAKDEFRSEKDLEFDVQEDQIVEEYAGMSCATKGAKSPYYIGTGDGFRNVYFQFTESNRSNVTNTCGWNEPADASFTAPWPTMFKYQMMLMSEGPGGFIMYRGCEQNLVYNVPSKPGHRYYIFVNDQDGMHDDNHGDISFCWRFE